MRTGLVKSIDETNTSDSYWIRTERGALEVKITDYQLDGWYIDNNKVYYDKQSAEG